MTTRYLGQWARERFPLANGVFFALLYALTLVVGRSALPGPIVLTVRDVPGLIALWSFFLWLRVLDEHKDFANDRIAHPDRVLSRGLVTLGHLRGVAVLALAFQLGVSLWIDGGVGPVTGWWLLSLVWSLLMAEEFFVRDWLRRHIMWYALSHMVVMVLLVAWVAAMGAPEAVGSPSTWVLAALVYVSGLAFEMGRKMRAPENEHPLADSYTQSLGIPVATSILVIVVAVVAILTVIEGTMVTDRISVASFTAAILGSTVASALLRNFLRRPTPRAAKRVEAGVGISILTLHATLLATIIHGRSLLWP